MSKPAKFWLVKGPNGPSSREHPTEGCAKAEAERLARHNPGMWFTVLEATCSVVRSDVHWAEHDEDKAELEEEAPF